MSFTFLQINPLEYLRLPMGIVELSEWKSDASASKNKFQMNLSNGKYRGHFSLSSFISKLLPSSRKAIECLLALLVGMCSSAVFCIFFGEHNNQEIFWIGRVFVHKHCGFRALQISYRVSFRGSIKYWMVQMQSVCAMKNSISPSWAGFIFGKENKFEDEALCTMGREIEHCLNAVFSAWMLSYSDLHG